MGLKLSRFHDSNTTLHSCIDLTLKAKMADFKEPDLILIIKLEHGRFSHHIIESNYVRASAGCVEWNFTFLKWIIILNYSPFNNWALFNFQILRVELVVLNHNWVGLVCLFFWHWDGSCWNGSSNRLRSLYLLLPNLHFLHFLAPWMTHLVMNFITTLSLSPQFLLLLLLS